MPLVKKILYNGTPLDIVPSEEDIVNANNPSDFSGDDFTSKNKAVSPNSVRVLKEYVDSAIIPEGTLTFDTIPTQGSDKPVTSNGIYNFVIQAINDFFTNHFVVLTQAEYDELENPDPNKFYMIYEPEIIEQNGST